MGLQEGALLRVHCGDLQTGPSLDCLEVAKEAERQEGVDLEGRD